MLRKPFYKNIRFYIALPYLVVVFLLIALPMGLLYAVGSALCAIGEALKQPTRIPSKKFDVIGFSKVRDFINGE